MTKQDENRELLVAVAGRLYHQRGLNAVPLSEVLCAAEVSEEQFRQAFGSQDDLVIAVVERQMDRIVDYLTPFCERLNRWEDLEQWRRGMLGLTAITGKLGCPVGVIAVESDAEGRTSQALQENLSRWARLHYRALKRMKGNGVFGESFDPRTAAQFGGAVLQGALLLTRAFQDEKMLDRAIGNFVTYLEGFRAPSREPGGQSLPLDTGPE